MFVGGVLYCPRYRFDTSPGADAELIRREEVGGEVGGEEGFQGESIKRFRRQLSVGYRRRAQGEG